MENTRISTKIYQVYASNKHRQCFLEEEKVVKQKGPLMRISGCDSFKNVNTINTTNSNKKNGKKKRNGLKLSLF